MLGALAYQGNDYIQAIEILEQAYAEAAEAPSLRGRIAMELAVALNNSGQLKRGRGICNHRGQRGESGRR